MLIHELHHLGLSLSEAKVYLTALGLGEILASTLAQKTGINRSSIYGILESLIKKGLINLTIRNHRKYFYCFPPDQILEIARHRLQEEELKIKRLNLILPELNMITHRTSENLPKIHCLQGSERLNQIYQEIHSPKSQLLCTFASFQNRSRSLLKFFINKFRHPLLCHQLMHKIILPSEEKLPSEFFRNNFLESRAIDARSFDFTPIIHLYNNKVTFIHDQKMPNAVIIESPVIFNSMKKIFDLYWHLGK